MKRISLLAAALLPLAAGASEKDLANWDTESVKGDQRVTDIMDAEVYTADGREVGEVRDVVLNADGNASLLIASNGRQASAKDVSVDRRNIETPADPRDTDVPSSAEVAAERNQADAPSVRQEQPDADDFEYRESDDLMRTAGGWTGEEPLAKLDWDDASFDPERSAIMLESDRIEFTGSAVSAERVGDTGNARTVDVHLAHGDVTASSLLGMDVNLENDESFGRIEDVLITDDGEASAFVVDSWDLVDKQRYAIPADVSAVDLRNGELNLGYSDEAFDDLEEFDFADLESSRK